MDAPHTESAIAWAERVISGEEVRCLYVRQACRRFLDDLEREDFAYIYDVEEAEFRCRWVSSIPHVKGRWASQKATLDLQPWQAFVLCNLFGWRTREAPAGLNRPVRRFLEAYIEVPRKNGKSFLAAAIGASMFCEGEYGGEIYTGATSERQAWEVFRPARQMFLRDEELREHYGVRVAAKGLTIDSTGARFEPLIGKPGDGSSPSLAIVDEYHEHDSSDMVDTMRTGMGARDEPLLLAITTAGVDFGGPCREMRGQIVSILSGEVSDDTVFGLIFTIDEGDEWDTVAALEKANPNLDVSINRRQMIQALERAKRSATEQNAYKTKHLNVWVGAKTSWLNMIAYHRCADRSIDLDAYRGRPAYISVDLSSKKDLASIGLILPDGNRVIGANLYYLPRGTVYGEHAVSRYRGWADSGHLIVTEGQTIDYDRIEADLLRLAGIYQAKAIGFDPWNATQFAQRMSRAGLPMVEVRATVANFSEPMKLLEADIIDRKYAHVGDPVSAWCFGNVVAKMDKKDNIYPDKERPENKIDGVVAQLMSYALMIGDRSRGASIYEERGAIIA